MATWRLLTNHMYVLLCVAREPDIRIREIALTVGITERAAQAILSDLAKGGYVEVQRRGRRNHYRIVGSARFPHPLLEHAEVGRVLGVLNDLLPKR
jgi:predicted ArsR family transcriptional regulator